MLGIFLSLLGIIAIVVCAIQVYKTAVDMGRNAVLWTFLTVGVGLFFQFILPFIIGIVTVVAFLIGGTPPDEIATGAFGLIFVVDIACWVLSIVGMFYVMKRVAIVPDDPPMSGSAPPPPPTF